MAWGIYLFQLMSKAPRLNFSSLLCGPPWAAYEAWPTGGVCRGCGPLAGLCPRKAPWGQAVKGPSERGSLWSHGGALLGKPGWC